MPVKQFMYRMGNQVSFHEPHCGNYRLFQATPPSKDNPFAIEQVDDGRAERVDIS